MPKKYISPSAMGFHESEQISATNDYFVDFGPTIGRRIVKEADFPAECAILMNAGPTQGLEVIPNLSIAGTPVLTGTEAEEYAGFTVSASGGVPPYEYAVSSGDLPGGITLDDESGAVAGTPTVPDTFEDIVITATDASGATADLPAFDITIEAA